MINSLKNLVSQVFYAPASASVSTVVSKDNTASYDNPFLHLSNNSYAINKPVKGGYFAGYYNGKPNIVGRKLFIEA